MKETTQKRNVLLKLRSLKEAVLEDEKREAKITIIKAGDSKNGRSYSIEALRSLMPLLLEDRKMYLDHKNSTAQRSIKEWAATIRSLKLNGNDLEAVVQIHDDWLWERAKQAPEEIGVSIDAMGTLKQTGDNKLVVEKIEKLNSVDFVSKPAAGGRLQSISRVSEELLQKEERQAKLKRLMESMKDDAKAQRELRRLLEGMSCQGAGEKESDDIKFRKSVMRANGLDPENEDDIRKYQSLRGAANECE